MNADAICVFAKVPEPGAVKTRLGPPFSKELAAEFYAAMLADILEATAGMAADLALTPVLVLHPWARHREIRALVPAVFRVVPQRGPDLGHRMDRAVREAAAAGARRVLVRGSDSPTLARSDLSAALDTLDHSDLVLCPDPDGGYGLLGLRRAVPGLLDHPMSTSSVLAETLERARQEGLRVATTEPGFDIDTTEDLTRLAAARREGRAGNCPRTLAFLDEQGLW